MKLCLVPIAKKILNQAWFTNPHAPKYVMAWRPCHRRISERDEACYEHGG